MTENLPTVKQCGTWKDRRFEFPSKPKSPPTPFRGFARNPFGWLRLKSIYSTTSHSRHTLQT